MKLKKISNSVDNKNYKININLSSYFKKNFCVGDTVRNKEDKMIGIIDKIKNGVIYVKYKDGIVERINQLGAKNLIEFVEETYIDNLQPTQTKQHKTINKHSLSDISFSQDTPIDKFAEQQYNVLKQQVDQNNKEITIRNIVELGIKKGLIDKDEYDVELLKATSMNDEDLEDYKNEILNFNSQSIVTSSMEDDDENLTEAEKMLKAVKNGTVQTAGNVDFSAIPSDTRSISNIKNSQNQQYQQFRGIEHNAQISTPPVITPVIAPAAPVQSFGKYDWMNEIDWGMGGRSF